MWPHSTARSATGMPGRVSTAGAATGTGASFGDRKGLFTHDTPGVPVTHGSIRERSGGRKRNRRAGSVDQARRTCATLGAAPIQSDMYILIRGARRGCNLGWLRAAREPSQGTLLSDSGMAPERSQYSALFPSPMRKRCPFPAQEGDLSANAETPRPEDVASTPSAPAWPPPPRRKGLPLIDRRDVGACSTTRENIKSETVSV